MAFLAAGAVVAGAEPSATRPLAAADPAATPERSTRPATRPVYRYRQPSRDGIGKVYLGREIAQVMGHLGADWLERPAREQEERPRQAIELMRLRPTDVVADIGAGSGYFSFRLADRVPQGRVLAVDIQQEMLDLIGKKAADSGVKNVVPVLGRTDDPRLPDAAVDVVLMVDAYHEFDQPFEMMTAIARALKPGGRVVQIEYRAEDPAVAIKPLHKMTEAQARLEAEAVGLRFIENVAGLPQQHLLVFEKPAPAGSSATSPPSATRPAGG